MSGEHVTECRLAGPVRPHDGVDLPERDLDVEAFEDRGGADLRLQILHDETAHFVTSTSTIPFRDRTP